MKIWFDMFIRLFCCCVVTVIGTVVYAQTADNFYRYAHKNPVGLCKKADQTVDIVGKSGKVIGSLPRYGSYTVGTSYIRLWDGKGYELFSFFGESLFRIKCARMNSFSGGLAMVTSDAGSVGYIDYGGEYVIEPKFKSGTDFSEGLASVQCWDTGLYAAINKRGEYAFAPRFDFMGQYSGGVAPASLNGVWGYVDGNGDTVIPFVYTSASSFSEGLAAVRKKGAKLLGYIDWFGNSVIPAVYTDGLDFKEGLAAVRDPVNRHWGYINRNGKMIIPVKYRNAGDFNEGFAVCRDESGKWIIIDKHENIYKNDDLAGSARGICTSPEETRLETD